MLVAKLTAHNQNPVGGICPDARMQRRVHDFSAFWHK